MKCPYCARKLSFWRFQCRACQKIIWRAPQILLVAVVGLISLGLLVKFIEFLATL